MQGPLIISLFSLLISVARAEAGQYIVMLKVNRGDTRASENNNVVLDRHLRSVRSFIQVHHNSRTGNATIQPEFNHIYRSHAILGYSGTFDSTVITKVKRMSEVALVEPDGVMYTTSKALQHNPPWGLARICHRKKVKLNSMPDYTYDEATGHGVTAYVIDTGINVEHKDFEGRARWGATFSPGSGNEDDHGHGTHVAGTIGGKTFGVAKGANLVAVKVLGREGSGSNSDIIAGINWAANDAKENGGEKGSVANMSLGGSFSVAVNMAIDQAVEMGLAFAVAAGNEDSDACDVSPASAKMALSVGATNIEDRRASFSNWGKCVRIFAPGEQIASAWIGSPEKTKTISGTSMASPHVAGLMAYFLSVSSARLTPAEIYSKVLQSGTRGVINELDYNSPNLMAYNMAS